MFNIDFENFNGPLDKLIELAQKKKIKIEKVNINEIIILYLDWINNNSDFDLASDYLVMASQLIEMKTRILLNKELLSNDEENFIDIFVSQIIEYKNIQIYSKILEDIGSKRINYSSKGKTLTSNEKFVYSTKYEKNNDRLIKTYQTLMNQFNDKMMKKKLKEVTLTEISIVEVKENISKRLKSKGMLVFSKINFKSKIELIVSFLAILDMNNSQQVFLKINEKDIEVYENKI